MVACSILIVDDEPEIRELLRALLTGEGHAVACASDGRNGARAMAAEAFDVVITDLLMPERDGLEFISEIRRDYPRVHIIAMSGGGHIARDSYLKIAKGFGAHVVLEKPFELAAVLEAVESVQKISGGKA